MDIADIAKMALDGVSSALDGVVLDAVFEYKTQGAYDAASRQYLTFKTELTCRAVIGTAKALKQSFPAFQIGPEDTLIYIEGLTRVPAVGDKITIIGKERIIKEIGDISGAGQFFEVVAA